jgi:cellobiose epimerase
MHRHESFHTILQAYGKAMSQELSNILDYWLRLSIDERDGGFYGKIGHDDNIDPTAPKGAVLNARILYAFSSAFKLTRDERYKLVAHRAYEYYTEHFMDAAYGGVYWTTDHRGEPLDTKKQIYALAFGVYALSEYYTIAPHDEIKQSAIQLYNDILQHAYDKEHGGYWEAFTRDWSPLEDIRLSAKDANEQKSMNTHLHVVEAFANLYKIWPNEPLKQKIKELLEIFRDHMIDPDHHHLVLFFADDWTPRSRIISYGHDIEAAWLLLEAARIIADDALVATMQQLAVKIADAVFEGIDGDDGLWYEYEAERQQLTREKHWWPQAEAMVGFFNAWQITGEEKYLQASVNSWAFVRQYILDKKGGEWVWGVLGDYSVMAAEDKAGTWKCPYHNTRACIEIIRRIRSCN